MLYLHWISFFWKNFLDYEKIDVRIQILKRHKPNPMCITASGNILASGNLCFRVFKLQLKVINKNVCYLYSV